MPTVNPVLAGCHPDPSICRVGDAFYVVNSSFSYYPGLPIHRSTDLVTWILVGHALVEDSWLDVGDGDVSDGVWAPTLRHHDGVFYLVFPLARGRSGSGFFVTTATDAAGPWSRPTALEGEGIDPSLFFDDDGRCWFTAVRDSTTPGATGPGEVWLREFDPTALRLVGPTHILWNGALTGAWVEAPHLYAKRGRYHLLGAEGGTESNHAVTAAVASVVTGPYRTDPRSPLLTHRHLGAASAIQNVGHADLVEGPDGESWAVVLATRPVDGHHTLGRETFLVPVEWEPAGPVLAPGSGRIDILDLGFVADRKADDWVSLRGPVAAVHDGADIVLAGSPESLGSSRTPAFLAVRQTSHRATLECTVDPGEVAEIRAGVAAFQNRSHYLHAEVEAAPGGSVLRVTQRRGDDLFVLAEDAMGHRPFILCIRCDPRGYTVETRSPDGATTVHAGIPHTALSTETAGGFVGVLLGITATGDTPTPVRFRDVTYAAQESLDRSDSLV